MNRILTSHAGSLIRPPEVVSYINAIGSGQSIDEAAYAECLRTSVNDIVRHQLDVGLDVIDDGEIGKVSWITYLYERVSGLELRPVEQEGSMLPPSRDRQHFPGAYAALDALDEAATRASNAGAAVEEIPSNAGVEWVCTGPMTYDSTAVERDIANLKEALAANGADESQGFLPVVAPASAYWLKNEHYEDEEAFVFGLADALHEEYKTIADSGLLLQVDDAVLMHEADSMLSEGKSWEDYRAWAELRVRALNHALRGIPEDRVRYHVCFGSWHGPHAYDPPLRDSVDLLLAVNAGYYSIEQANPRHEHEWRIWEEVEAARGPQADPGRRHPPHQRRRAPRAGRAAARSPRQRRRRRERDRRHRLRVRAGRDDPARPRGDPVGEADRARRGRRDRLPRAVGSGGRSMSTARGHRGRERRRRMRSAAPRACAHNACAVGTCPPRTGLGHDRPRQPPRQRGPRRRSAQGPQNTRRPQVAPSACVAAALDPLAGGPPATPRACVPTTIAPQP